jgi:hypothetical protein
MTDDTTAANNQAALINELIGTRDHLLAAIRNHRAQKGFNGKISSDDYRLWEAAGLGDAGWADIPGDM